MRPEVGTFFASRRNQVIVAVAAIILLVIALLVALGVGRGNKVGTTSSTGSVTVSPSPSPSVSPSPSPSPSPTPVPSPSPSTAPTPAPTAAPSGPPPATPVTTGPVVSASGAELQAQPGTTHWGSGGSCAAWTESGWTPDSCGLIAVRSAAPEGSVGWAVEKITSTNAWRVILLAFEPSDNMWHVRLAAGESGGGNYSAIAVKEAMVSGDSQHEVVVGFRLQGTAHILSYDIVELGPGQELTVAAHRGAEHGAAKVGTQLIDWSCVGPSDCTKTTIGYAGGHFHILSQGPSNTAEAGDFP